MATKPGHASIESEYELHDYDTAYLVTKPENPNKSIKRQLSKKEAAKLRWLPCVYSSFVRLQAEIIADGSFLLLP